MRIYISINGFKVNNPPVFSANLT